MKAITKKSSFLLIAVFILIILTGGQFCLATESSARKTQIEKTDKILSIFNVFTGSKKPGTGNKAKTKEVIFPEHLVPTELRAEVSSKTIEAETSRITDSRFSRKQLLLQTTDSRQAYRPNYKLVSAIVLTVAYILCSCLVHRYHNKNLPKHT